MRFFIYIIALAGSLLAFTIPNGECLNLTLFDDTTNTTNITEFCAGNATIIYNVTNVTNITFVECNATNATLWANSSGVFNNASITCLANNTTIIQNQTVYVNVTQNVSVPIPTNYCYQNINQNLSGLGIFRNDPTNITVICMPIYQNVSVAANCPEFPGCPTCPTCQTCQTCEAQRECAAPRICEPSRLGELLDCNNTVALMSAELNRTKTIQKEVRDEVQLAAAPVIAQAEASQNNLNNLIGAGIFGVLGVIVVWKVSANGMLSGRKQLAQTDTNLESQLEYLKKRKEKIMEVGK